jgi:BirA family biotin operon repressor/biotin-[acetyl-CoA-carboxylase] ligase
LLAALPQPVLRELDRQVLACQILMEMHRQFARIEDDFHDAIKEVRSRSWLLGRQIRATVDGNEIFGRAVDLDAEGHLLLALADGTVTTLSSAEGVRQVW